MRSFHYSIHIERSPAQVWAFMLDFEKAPLWRPHVRDIRILTDGPLRVGSEVQFTFDLPGRVRTARCEVWAFETAKRFGLRNTTEKVTGTFEYLLTASGSGTDVVFACDLRPTGVMWLLLPMMMRTNRDRFAHHLTNLKREVERA